jgi:hypothetical protein
MNTGFFIYCGRTERLAFRCSCGFNIIFGDDASKTPEVTCCRRTWKYQKPKPTFWDFLFGIDELPRVKPKAPPFVLQGRRQEPDEDLQTEQ